MKDSKEDNLIAGVQVEQPQSLKESKEEVIQKEESIDQKLEIQQNVQNQEITED